jgi:hypothetical protein
MENWPKASAFGSGFETGSKWTATFSLIDPNMLCLQVL